MAQYAQVTFPFLDHVILEICPHGVVTGDTGKHLSGMLVEHFRSHRMGEVALSFVALYADCITVIFQHGQVPAAMGCMASGTVINRWVFGYGLSVATHSFTMAGVADHFFPIFQKGLVISGMGRVTVEAAVTILYCYVAVVGKHFFTDIFMAFQTGCHADLCLTLVTGGTVFDIRLVQEIPHQSFSLTAMGIMAGETTLESHRVIFVAIGQCGFILMAGETERVGFIQEKL